MILSASRRTDIPAYYSEWMINRLREGYVVVPNPRNPHRLSKVILTPENVDCIVFWSKDPTNMLQKLHSIEELGYQYYFEYTITAFGSDVERYLPDKESIIETFLKLSERIGAERVDWRFDPIMVTDEYPVDRHLERFEYLCSRLSGHTKRCIISFVDPYRHLGAKFKGMSREQIKMTAEGISRIARKYHLPLYSCAEEIDLSELEIGHSACIDPKKIERIIGVPIAAGKDSGQRSACGCAASVDIGMYDTCGHGCAYCYATFYKQTALKKRMAGHKKDSPMLIGEPLEGDVITERREKSCKMLQMRLPLT